MEAPRAVAANTVRYVLPLEAAHRCVVVGRAGTPPPEYEVEAGVCLYTPDYLQRRIDRHTTLL
jgi:hypothetical protein